MSKVAQLTHQPDSDCLQINVLVFFPRYLNDKQKALISAYAELEDDVNGTVNGIDKSTKGINGILCRLKHNFFRGGGRGGVGHFPETKLYNCTSYCTTKINQAENNPTPPATCKK